MKNLNDRGEIQNQAAHEKVDPIYLPLFESVIQAAQQTFNGNLHSIYAYGSIAEGRAVRAKSDADFIIALKQPDEQMASQLENLSQRVFAEFSDLVSKIDLPAGTCEEILAPDNLYSWGAYLKILGLPIFGEDLRKQLPDFKPSLTLAKAWNGDLRQDIQNALDLLAGPASKDARQRNIRGIASKSIRALYLLIVPQTQDWTTLFSEQADQVLQHFPEYADTLNALISARKSDRPLDDISVFRAVLQRFSAGLLVEFETQLAK